MTTSPYDSLPIGNNNKSSGKCQAPWNTWKWIWSSSGNVGAYDRTGAGDTFTN